MLTDDVGGNVDLMFTPRMLSQAIRSFPLSGYGQLQAVLYSSFAVFSIGYAVATTLPPHRIWAVGAGLVYLSAAVASYRGMHERLVLRLVAVGALFTPLLFLVAADVAQPEVSVVVDAAQRFLGEGTPYLSDPHTVEDYNPYSPLMVVFGLPTALLGDWIITDPRLWFLGFFGACLLVARSLLPDRAIARFRPLAFVLVSPLVAVTVATSGIDLPLIGLLVLALAAAWMQKGILAGVLLGCAIALKWTALPVVGIILIVLWRRGSLLRAVASVVATVTVAWSGILAGAYGALDSFIEHTVMFPLGRGAVATPAGDSVLGGVLQRAPGGTWVIYLLLIMTASAIAVALMSRQLGVFAVAACTAIGFTTLFLLAPSARAGYFVLPAVLVAAAYAYRRDSDSSGTASFAHGHENRSCHDSVENPACDDADPCSAQLVAPKGVSR